MNGFTPPFVKPFAGSYEGEFIGGRSSQINFDFSTLELSSEFQFVRSDSVSTYRDSDGKMQLSPSNTARFDHTEQGDFLGILIEDDRANVCEPLNRNPTVTTGFTLSGGTLEIVNDAAELALAGLDEICSSGNVYRFTSDGGTALCTIDGGTLNTNPHSYHCYARAVGSGAEGDFRISGAGVTDVNIPYGGSYAKYEVENETPDGVGREARIVARDGNAVYFILFQLEEGTYGTSTMITDGGAGGVSASQDVMRINNIETKDYWDTTQGFMSMRFIPRLSFPDIQYLFTANNNATTNTLGVRVSNNNDGFLRGYVRAPDGSTQNASACAERPMAGDLAGAWIVWDTTESTIGGGGAEITQPMNTSPSGLITLNVGARNSNSQPFIGHINSFTIGKQPDKLAAARASIWVGETKFIAFGQSNIENEFTDSVNGTPAGKEAFIAEGENYFPNILYGAGAEGGVAMIRSSVDPSTNYIWDDITDQFNGEGAQKYIRGAVSIGNSALGIVLDQGEGDAGDLGTGTITRAQLKSGWLDAIAAARNQINNLTAPVVITRLGRRTAAYSQEQGWNDLRDLQKEIADENPNIHLGPDKIDLPMQDETGATDTVHLDTAGYETKGRREIRKMASVLGKAVTGGIDSPTILSAIRAGTTVTVTIAHAQGTDIAPATGIEGFSYDDNGTPIAVNSAVRTNANTITLTLASEPSSGNETLYYGFGVLLGIDPAQLVVDNTAEALPLACATIPM